MAFKIYGVLGLLIIIFCEITSFLKIFPGFLPFTTTIWIGYILLIDAIVYKLRKNSYIMNSKKKFILLFVLSAVFWWIFELINIYSKYQAWFYNFPEFNLGSLVHETLAFSTILPAVFESWQLLKTFHIFGKTVDRIKFPVNNFVVTLAFILGVIFIVIPFVWASPWIWAFVWTGFIFLLDPILYLFGDQRSLLYQLKKHKLHIILSIFFAGYITGFFWEYWNFLAHAQWTYTIPILDQFRIFAIPVLGFLAYGPFALELYVMYNFARLLIHHKPGQHLVKI